AKAYELRSMGINVSVSNLLECKATATDKDKGLDLADYLIRFGLSEFKVKPVWLKDAITTTHQCKIGKLSENDYIDYLIKGCKQNNLTLENYVETVNEN
ncbi:MAG: hypothetical protein ACRDE2_07850, partial [Chitinophagaceae bacterium]